MEQNKEDQSVEKINSDRREALQKIGRFTAYAAPFTLLALTAQAASGSGAAPSAAKKR
jgi:hypothetical protein